MRELLKRVVEECGGSDSSAHISTKLYCDILEELEKPEPEPAGYVMLSGHGDYFRRSITEDLKLFWKPVYTHPPRQPEPVFLTEDDIKGLIDLWESGFDNMSLDFLFAEIEKAVLRKNGMIK